MQLSSPHCTVERLQLVFTQAQLRDSLLLRIREGEQPGKLVSPRAAETEATLYLLPGRVAKGILHLEQRPGPLHVGEVGPILVLGVLHLDALGWREWVNDDGVKAKRGVTPPWVEQVMYRM
jgi:hypothetical protein